LVAASKVKHLKDLGFRQDMKKRGIEMTLSTIVVLILLLIALLVLAVFFTQGFDKLNEAFAGLADKVIAGAENVEVS